MPGTVKFTSNYSAEKIEFLDIEVSIEGGKLETNLYIKPTNLQLFLDFFSNHPAHCKKSKGDVDSHLANLNEKLAQRNYPQQLIQENFNKAKQKNRKDLILKPRRPRNHDDKICLIFTHNEGNPPLHKWMREVKKQLVKNEKAIEMGDRLQISTRQPKNLKRIVTGSNSCGGAQPPPQPRGCFKCEKRCKVACPILKEGSNFTSTNTKKVYTMKHHLTCDSSYIVYLGTCKKCGGQYVGKTTRKFKQRHSGHKQEVKRSYGGLGHHYGGQSGCGYDSISMQIIDQVEAGDDDALAESQEPKFSATTLSSAPPCSKN